MDEERIRSGLRDEGLVINRDSNPLIIGDHVNKRTGYKFPGVVVAVFYGKDGRKHLVVELNDYGLFHIFDEKNLVRKPPPIVEVRS